MPEWLPILILIFATIIVLDAIGSFILYRYSKSKLFLKSGVAWVANFINFLIHGTVSGHTGVTLFGHSFYYITACFLASMLNEIIDEKTDTHHYILLGISSLVASEVLFAFSHNYMLSALILDLAIAYPMVSSAYKAVFVKKSAMIVKIFAFILTINALHFLDYPFLYDSPKGNIFGFSVAFLINVILSIFIPSIILHLQSKKYTDELERIVEERTRSLVIRGAELEVLNQENSTLVAIVCHDISTPVALANFHLGRVFKDHSNLSPEVMRRLDKVSKSLVSTNELLKKVKEMHASRLGKIEPLIQEVDLLPLIEEVVQMYEPRTSEKNIAINIVEVDQEKKYAMLDPILFKNQILGNLLSNAIKFSEENGRVDIFLEKRNDHICVRIVDYGMGIPSHKLADIFSFNKATTTRGTLSELGTGLGLPTVKVIAEKMGGSVSVNSSERELNSPIVSKNYSTGTTFSLNFKIAQ